MLDDTEFLGEGLTGRQLYLAAAPAFSEWPDELASITPPFFLVAIADARAASAAAIGAFAAKLLGQGAGYVSAWGPDCGRVHDIFDEVLEGSPLAPLLVTDWLPDEPLDDALWFAAVAAFNEDFPDMSSVLFAVIEQGTSSATAVREWVAREENPDTRQIP